MVGDGRLLRKGTLDFRADYLAPKENYYHSRAFANVDIDSSFWDNRADQTQESDPSASSSRLVRTKVRDRA